MTIFDLVRLAIVRTAEEGAVPSGLPSATRTSATGRSELAQKMGLTGR